jgi:DNA-binding SARP family transcriptional activator
VATRTSSLRPSRIRLGVPEVRLLDGFELLVGGEPVELPRSSQRLLALVALHDKPVQRSYVAGALWLDSPEERAHANLRSALWRLHRVGTRLVETHGSQLQLGRAVVVDIREAGAAARRVLAGGEPELDPRLLDGDLLPDWYDEWLVFERERHRQLRLRALELLCERLADAGRCDEALRAGLAAVASEPLRESAHRAVIRVHLAEGNIGEAIRQAGLCRRLLREQLGIEPSSRLEEALAGV